MSPALTPPLYPISPPTGSTAYTFRPRSSTNTRSPPISPSGSPDFALPPPSLAHIDHLPSLNLPGPRLPFQSRSRPLEPISEDDCTPPIPTWRPDLSPAERDIREAYLAGGRGRPGLRIVIVTENFLPKVDGVTRTLARLLEHLEKEGHQCMLLGPETGMGHYASHPLVGTAGVPLVLYPGLKLNFLRPKFLRTIKEFQPDVVHFVDPIWLGAQTLVAMELGWAGEEWVSEEGPAIGAGIRGAVVASYHTTLITLCPSPSTAQMLTDQNFSGVRLWPRGVDLSQFGRGKRCRAMRAGWGVGDVSSSKEQIGTAKMEKEGVNTGQSGTTWNGRKASLPMTPPLTPWSGPVDAASTGAAASTAPHDSMSMLSLNDGPTSPSSFTSHTFESASDPARGDGPLPRRAVLLYVGRISWEKNLHLLLSAYSRLSSYLAGGTPLPKLVFVGDGPARVELEAICTQNGYDAVFIGHRSGDELARCYASADVFAFPSFTETFGQVVLEALASGLAVVGLDAEGTRDLVKHEQTGLLLPLPTEALATSSASSPRGVGAAATTSKNAWPAVCRDQRNPLFISCAERYAALLARAVCNAAEREEMGERASREGIEGYTWWDAMEKCVDGYRESLRLARAQHSLPIISHSPPTGVPDHTHSVDGCYTPSSSPLSKVSSIATPTSPSSRISRVNRVVSRRLAHKGKWMPEASTVGAAASTGDMGSAAREWRDHRGDLLRGSGGVLRLRRAMVDTSESVWHLSVTIHAKMPAAVHGIASRIWSIVNKGVYAYELETLLKLVLAIALFYGVYSHHVASRGLPPAVGMLRAGG